MSTEIAEAIGNCVRQNVPWHSLPVHLKNTVLNNECDYDKFIFNFSLKNQLRFRGNIVSKVFKHEQRYYELLVQESKSINGLCLFPYHLADVVTKGLRVTPFNFYLDVLSQLLRNDKSYDTLPNFTAADCLRVLGIGRNEYLSLISELKTHSTRALLFSSKPNPLEFLPRFPVRIRIEPWWRIEIGYVLETDVRYVNDAERSLIDDLIDFGSQTAGKCSYEVVHSLYRKGLIYLDVPISSEDRICIPPLRNFVMNRTSGDYFENLLYKIFVSADEHMTILELSQMLQVELDAVKQAVSFFCRIGFAQLKESSILEYEQLQQGTTGQVYHVSWDKYKEDQQKLQDLPQITPLNYNALLNHTDIVDLNTTSTASTNAQVPNANSPSPGPSPRNELKCHSTTNNTNGNQNDSKDSSSIGYLSSDGNTSDFSFALPSPTPPASAANACSTPATGNRSSPEEPELSSEIDDLSESTTKLSIKEATTVTTSKSMPERLDKTGKRVGFLFDSTLTAFLMMGNLSPGLKNHAVTMFEVGKLCEESLDTFLSELEKVSLLDAEGEGDVSRYFAHAVILRSTICSLRYLLPGGLDLLRLECLECLDQKTRDRILEKKYKFIISATPLTASLSHLLSIPFYGQFYRSSDSSHMWTKLFYNHISGYGPPSLFLCRGTVLRTLPRIFLGYGKLLVNILHSDSYIINSENFRNLNDQLKNGCVLIQGYGIRTPGELRYESFPFDEQDQRQTAWANHNAVKKLGEHLDLKGHCGFITFLNTGVPDIGCETHCLEVCLRHPKSKIKPTNVPGHAATSTKTTSTMEKQDSNEKMQVKITTPTDQEKTMIGLDDSAKNDLSASAIAVINRQSNAAVSGLKSPDENYFAVTPQNGSPSNVFTSADCSELLACELAKCQAAAKHDNETEIVPNMENMRQIASSNRAELVSQGSVEIPLIGKFDSAGVDDTGIQNDDEFDALTASTTESWTLLDVNFGVPLFDVDANTRICEQIVRRLCHDDKLKALPIAATKMNETFLNFIQQCLYFEDEHHENFRIGKVLPHPRVSLAFENGRVCYWSGR